MPKKKKSSNSKIIAVLIVAVVVGAIIIIHDGLVGITPIEDILEWNLVDGYEMNDGVAVTIKGTVVSISGDWMIVNDGTGSLGFDWNSADDFDEGAVVVVRGVTDTTLVIVRILTDVSSVQQVWLIR